MDSTRKHARYRVMHNYLVFDDVSKRLLGRAVDISLGGFKVVGQSPVPEGVVMRCRLVFPAPIEGARELTIDATTKWCVRESDEPNWEFGFELVGLKPDELEIQKALVRDVARQAVVSQVAGQEDGG